MLIRNPRAHRAPYPDALASLLDITRAHQDRDWLRHWSAIAPAPTPLRALPGLAAALGIASLHVKDESVRSPLGSFKALGAPVALLRHVLRACPGLDAAGVLAGHHAARLAELTVISATDGNHGRALAAAARDAGCACVIVLHAHVGAEREAAIAPLGARIVRIAGNYDASVAEAARLADANGWQVVSDTSYAGYEDIPRDVMQGYGVIAAEVTAQTAATPDAPAFTHVFLQGGVGGLAAGVLSYFWQYHGAQRPRVVVVEPRQADCLLQSARQGRPAPASGSVDSVMAGLACGEPSPLAWRFLETGAELFMTIEDADAVAAMRVLARGSMGDVPVLAGESGAAGLAGLRVVMADPALAGDAGLDADARVLVVNTEGATAPRVYADLAGEPAEAVLARQRAWQARQA